MQKQPHPSAFPHMIFNTHERGEPHPRRRPAAGGRDGGGDARWLEGGGAREGGGEASERRW
jgi:hypothetical protein